MTEDASFDQLKELLEHFIDHAIEELDLRWQQWEIDLSRDLNSTR